MQLRLHAESAGSKGNRIQSLEWKVGEIFKAPAGRENGEEPHGKPIEEGYIRFFLQFPYFYIFILK